MFYELSNISNTSLFRSLYHSTARLEEFFFAYLTLFLVHYTADYNRQARTFFDSRYSWFLLVALSDCIEVHTTRSRYIAPVRLVQTLVSVSAPATINVFRQQVPITYWRPCSNYSLPPYTFSRVTLQKYYVCKSISPKHFKFWAILYSSYHHL